MKLNMVLLKDWKFVFKGISFVICALLMLCGFIWGFFIDYWYISPNESKIAYPRLYNSNVILSFWSVHTNILVMMWFLYALIYHKREQNNKFTNLTAQINITVYITVTFLLFWAIIVGNILKISIYNFASRTTSDIIITSLTHALTPLLMISYCLLTIGQQHYDWKKIWTMPIFPIFYCIFVMLRAKLVIGDGIEFFKYPYPFINFSKPLFGNSLSLSNFVCLFSLLILLIIFSTFYIGINNYRFKLQRQKNGGILT